MTENTSLDGLSEETQSYIRSLRAEAARYRTERNENQTKLAEVTAKYAEAGSLLQTANTKLDELSAIKDTNETNSAELARVKALHERETIAWDAGLTREDAARLVGSTPEELKADAAKLAARVVPSNGRRPVPPDPAADRNGVTPGPDEENPIKKAFRDAGMIGD